jgi:hypothetical protein
MKKEEFNLSEKIIRIGDRKRMQVNCNCIYEEDVKEFIKRLKEELIKNIEKSEYLTPYDIIRETIDKLAGEKLK